MLAKAPDDVRLTPEPILAKACIQKLKYITVYTPSEQAVQMIMEVS